MKTKEQSNEVRRTTLTSFDKATQLEALYGVVPGSSPTKLVVFCHGYHESIDDLARFLERFASDTVITLAISYRNDQQFPVLLGSQDVIAGTEQMMSLFPSIQKTYLVGMSMGGAIAGVALSESWKLGKSLFHYLVDIQGVANLVETYLEAKIFYPEAADAILQDVGGGIFTNFSEYCRRSPVFITQNMKKAGLKGAIIVYAPFDVVVPFNQAIELKGSMLWSGIPLEFVTVVRGKEGDMTGDTWTSVIANALHLPDINLLLNLNLAGHAPAQDSAPLKVALDRLTKMLNGEYEFESLKQTVVLYPLEPDTSWFEQSHHDYRVIKDQPTLLPV